MYRHRCCRRYRRVSVVAMLVAWEVNKAVCLPIASVIAGRLVSAVAKTSGHSHGARSASTQFNNSLRRHFLSVSIHCPLRESEQIIPLISDALGQKPSLIASSWLVSEPLGEYHRAFQT